MTLQTDIRKYTERAECRAIFQQSDVLRDGNKGRPDYPAEKEIDTADAIVIGAGAGLSTSAGLTYSGERFERYFFDFAQKFGIRDIYSEGFYPFPDDETRWAWWARHIYYNRCIDAPKPVYRELLELMANKDSFVITTNVDHQFQRAGFDKRRLFYTQGDYGLFQSVDPSNQKTYDNEAWVMAAMEAQGFVKDADGIYQVPDEGGISMRISTSLIPKCPDDGSDVTMNLRADDSFVEDDGWHRASATYSDFLRRHENLHVLYLELGVLLGAVVYFVNGSRSFLNGFLVSYGLWLIVDWYDAIVIDILWLCHSKIYILPGTEDMTETYHDYGYHIKGSCVGMLIGLPVCLLIGLVIQVISWIAG